MEPGGHYDCDMHPTAGSCVAQEVTATALCHLVGGDDCEQTSGGTSWQVAEDAHWEPTEMRPGPLLPSEQQVCQNQLSNIETVKLGSALVAIGVLAYGLWSGICGSSWPSPPQEAPLVGDDELVIDSDGGTHRGTSRDASQKISPTWGSGRVAPRQVSIRDLQTSRIPSRGE